MTFLRRRSLREKGFAAEDYARDYLEQQGLTLRDRNYRCKAGEIDLIMQDKDSVVFIEVRFRHKQNHGSSAETVTYFKQKKLIQTALMYLQEKQLWEKVPCRFDVVAITLIEDKPQVDWIKNAFQTE